MQNTTWEGLQDEGDFNMTITICCVDSGRNPMKRMAQGNRCHQHLKERKSSIGDRSHKAKGLYDRDALKG